jgi:hypothetical protein
MGILFLWVVVLQINKGVYLMIEIKHELKDLTVIFAH